MNKASPAVLVKNSVRDPDGGVSDRIGLDVSGTFWQSNLNGCQVFELRAIISVLFHLEKSYSNSP